MTPCTEPAATNHLRDVFLAMSSTTPLVHDQVCLALPLLSDVHNLQTNQMFPHIYILYILICNLMVRNRRTQVLVYILNVA